MERIMKKLLLSFSLLASLHAANAMEQPAHHEVVDYCVKNAIVTGIEKANTSIEAVQAVDQLVRNPLFFQQAQEGYFDQLILGVVRNKFAKSLLPFFGLNHGIGQRLAQEYFKNVRNFNKETDQNIVKELLRDNWTVLVGKGIENTEVNIDEQISQVIDKHTTKVICNPSNQVVGFITYACQRIFGECNIKFITVDAQAQGNGFGRKLIEYAEYDAYKQKLKSIYLRVFQDNISAINFYRNLGFMSINHNYHMPAFTMKKEI